MKVLAGIGTQAGAENGFGEFFTATAAVPATVVTLNADGSAEAVAVLIAKTKGAINIHHVFRNETKGGSPKVRATETADWLEQERYSPDIGTFSYARGSEDYPFPLVHSIVMMNEPNLAGEHSPEWDEPKTYASYERMSEDIIEQLREWELVIPARGLDLADFPLDFPALSPRGDPSAPNTMSKEFRDSLVAFWGFVPEGHSAEYRLLFAAYRAYLQRGLRIHFHEYLFRSELDRIHYGNVAGRNNLKPTGYTNTIGEKFAVAGDDAVRNPDWWTSANRFFDESAPVLQDMFARLGFPAYENVGCKEFNVGGDHAGNQPQGVDQSFEPFLAACQRWNDEAGGFQIIEADWFLGYTHPDESHYRLCIWPHRPWIIDEMRRWNGATWTLPPAIIDVGDPAPIPPAPSPKPTPDPTDPDAFDPNPLDLPVGDGIYRAGARHRKLFISGEHWFFGVRRAFFTGSDASPRPGYILWAFGRAQVFEDAAVAVEPKAVPPPLPPEVVIPTGPEVLGIDLSNLSRYRVTAERVECMIQDHAIRTAVVGIFPDQPDIARYQLGELAKGGFDSIQVYGEPTTTTGARFRDVIEIAKSTGIEIGRYWIDVEPVPSFGFKPTRDGINRAIEECERAGVPYGIYSGTWAWDELGFGDEYKTVPVWWASYLPLGAPAPSSMAELNGVANPFGVWSRELVIAWQYTNTRDLCEVPVDRNLFRIGG